MPISFPFIAGLPVDAADNSAVTSFFAFTVGGLVPLNLGGKRRVRLAPRHIPLKRLKYARELGEPAIHDCPHGKWLVGTSSSVPNVHAF